MAKFTDYTQKTKPADADLLLIHDNAGAANKKTPFSGVWSWILDKLASAVISQLETTHKSIIPAINELNSKTVTGSFNIKKFSTEGNYKKVIITILSNDTHHNLLVYGDSNQNSYFAVLNPKSIVRAVPDEYVKIAYSNKVYTINLVNWSYCIIVSDKSINYEVSYE